LLVLEGEQGSERKTSSMEGQARAFVDEVLGSFEQKKWMLDLGHPLLNRIAESFVKAAGVRSALLASAHLCFLQNLSLPQLTVLPGVEPWGCF
jgi:hypothetical protein